MSALVSPKISSSPSLGFRVAPLYLPPALALSLILTWGALVPQVAQAQSYTLSTLANFNGTNGQGPDGGVTLDRNGNLYGTTYSGGASNDGTVFEIAAGTSTITTLATLSGTVNGANPDAGVTLDSSGNLYGTTYQGGANNDGTVFKIAVGTSTITTLTSFNDANGANPYGGVTLDSSGNLYGTTTNGGAKGYGTVFKIAAGTNAFTTLATFNYTNGANPQGGVTLDSGGNLYGTTDGGGTGGAGTVFKIAAGTNTLTTLANFNTNNNDVYGSFLFAGVTLDSSGNLYGTTAFLGGGGYGTVFKIAAGTNTLTALATFNNSNGAQPRGGVTLDSSGNLYGTTSVGGANNDGTVFKIGAGTNAFSTLATFTGVANGTDPVGNLVLDSGGNLYGTTGGGGASGDGTVFTLTLTGTASAPEPSALLLLLATSIPGTLGLAVARRRRNTA